MGIMPPDFSGSPRSIPQEGFRQSRQGEIPAETPAPGKQEGKPPLPGKISFPQVSSQDVLPFQSIFKNLAIALGIPQDTLSSQLIAFFRYFSLPLEGEILSKLRRDLLLSQGAAPEMLLRGRDLKSPAAVLGAAAGVDKGVRLSPEALMEYAAAIDPEKEQSGEEKHQGGTGHSPDRRHPKDRERGKADPSDDDRGDSRNPGKLREKFENLGARHPLLDLLNRLPGKNGQRWILFPFTFESGDVSIRVSVRILVKDPGASYGETRLILDVLGKNRRWIFKLSGYGIAHSRAYVGVSPPLSRRALKSLEGELRKHLEGIAEEVYLENREEPLPAEGEIREGPLGVNEKI